MTSITEILNDTSGLNETGDIVPRADDPSDESAIEWTPYISEARDYLAPSPRFEVTETDHRASTVPFGEVATGVVVTLDEHRRDIARLRQFVEDDRTLGKMAAQRSGSVQARRNRKHMGISLREANQAHDEQLRLVREEFPKIFHTQELIDAGFDPVDVNDHETIMRGRARSKL